MSARTSFNELLETGAHFGHLKSKWNPAMAPYIYAEKNGIHIIDLNKTIAKNCTSLLLLLLILLILLFCYRNYHLLFPLLLQLLLYFVISTFLLLIGTSDCWFGRWAGYVPAHCSFRVARTELRPLPHPRRPYLPNDDPRTGGGSRDQRGSEWCSGGFSTGSRLYECRSHHPLNRAGFVYRQTRHRQFSGRTGRVCRLQFLRCLLDSAH